MPTNFLLAAGTSGFIVTPFTIMSTELNSLASGSAATSSVNGASGVFYQGAYGSAPFSSIYFTSGGSFTPGLGGFLAGWWLRSPDGGSTFETPVATASTSIMALPRAADFVIPLDNAAIASGNIKWGQPALNCWEYHKVLIQNLSGSTVPSGSTIKAGPTATQY